MTIIQSRQKKQSLMYAFLFALAFCFAFSCMAVAQFDQASISGVVQDTTGAAISNAVMTLTNLDNGFVMKIKTDKKGGYQFSPIKIGHYSLSAAAPNFVKMTMLNIYLHLEDKQDIPFVLKPMQ